MIRCHRLSTLFPYPTLFRSHRSRVDGYVDTRRDVLARNQAFEVCFEGLARHSGEATKVCELRRIVARLCHPLVIHFRLEIARSEEHTSELQSRPHLVCRLLL